MSSGGRRVGAALALALAMTGCGSGAGEQLPPPRAGAGPSATVGSPRLVPVDGGVNYYARWPGTLPTDASYFPVGVWLEGVNSAEDVTTDRAAGLNLYAGLTANSDLSLLAGTGMSVLAQSEWLGRVPAGTQPVAGWLVSDGVDMQLGPGKGFTAQSSALAALPAGDGRLRYANYGKGVAFWESDADAARFVRRYQDVVSASAYWFTDPEICGPSQGGVFLAGRPDLPTQTQVPEPQCRLAANYGRTVDRVRALESPAGSKPVFTVVEVGHPSTQSTAPSITPPQVAAAVWSGIIHGARGVVYFDHSFGGPAPTQHALREPAYAPVRAAVIRTNRQIRALAPVLNSPSVQGLVTTGDQVDTLVKDYGGTFYILAGSATSLRQRVTFDAPCLGDARVTVLDEGRTLTMTHGRLVDEFPDGNAYHLYRVDGRGSCTVR